MKEKRKKIPLKILMSLIVSAIFAVCLQITVHFANPLYQIIFIALMFAVCFLITVIPKYKFKRYIVSIVCILAATGIVCGSFVGLYRFYQKDSAYKSADSTNDFFKNKTVLIIVPHEDDDVNTTGGIIDLFTQNGSDVHVLFTTNGDYEGLGETRLHESLNVAKHYNLPEENIIFLGYANGWYDGTPHIYHAEPDTILKSYINKTETYGIDSHPAYNDGNAYTRNNLKKDLTDAVLEVNPDMIFCVDCDFHNDHRMTSLIFEESMSEILSQNNDFRPLVFKAFAYSTAYYGNFDFYSKNILSTKNKSEKDIVPDINIYKWSERLRLPVASSALSRYLKDNSTYESLALYESQYIITQAEGIINGDKVFWQRSTDSILYNADIFASSGDAGLLNNFKLLDYKNIAEIKSLPYDGVWIPDTADSDKKITVNLKNPSDISEICLYDNPSTEDNILNAEIEFDNGAVIESGKLESNGSATAVACNQKNIKSFEITIKDSEGKAGLTEIEAYYEKYENDNVGVMKLINSNDDFVYDYYIDKSGKETFGIYKYGCEPAGDSDYTLSCDNKACSAEIKDGKVTVSCPKGQKCTITITDNKNNLSDSVVISNPKDIVLRNLAQKFDKGYNKTYSIPNQIQYYYSMKSEIFKLIFG